MAAVGFLDGFGLNSGEAHLHSVHPLAPSFETRSHAEERISFRAAYQVKRPHCGLLRGVFCGLLCAAMQLIVQIVFLLTLR